MSRIFGKVNSPYNLDQVLQTGNSARDRHMEDVSNIFFSDGGDYQNDTAIISQDITTLFMEINTLDTSVNLLSRCGSYYKTTQQLANSGDTDITFDVSESWTDSGFIDLSGGSGTDFVVHTAGIYRLSAILGINPNGQSWTNGSSKVFSIDITRPSDIERVIIPAITTPLSGVFFFSQTSAIKRLEIGDVINLRSSNYLSSGGQYGITGVSPGNLDRNTEFQFQYIKP